MSDDRSRLPGAAARAGSGTARRRSSTSVAFAYRSAARRAAPGGRGRLATRRAGRDRRARRAVAAAGRRRCWSSSAACRRRDAGTRRRRRRAVLMPQRDLLLPWLDALDNAALALRITGARRDEARARGPCRCCTPSASRASSTPARDELSGGMRQRVAFLRTLLAGKPVLCLDEPFGALDALTRAEMRRLARRPRSPREPRTTLLVTHDVEEACVLADRVVVLSPRPARVRGDRRRRRSRGRGAAPTRRSWRCARARAGGAAPALIGSPLLIRRSSLLLRRLGALRRDRRTSTTSSCPRRPRSRQALSDDRGLLWDNFCVTATEVGARASSSALVAGALLAIAIHLSPVLRRALYPLLVGSQAVPIVDHRAAAGRLVRLRHRAEARDHRARLLLPRRRHDARRARRASTPSSASCCARSTPRAGRSCAGSRRPRRCPAR